MFMELLGWGRIRSAISTGCCKIGDGIRPGCRMTPTHESNKGTMRKVMIMVAAVVLLAGCNRGGGTPAPSGTTTTSEVQAPSGY